MKLPNYDQVAASGGESIPMPPAGGYVCRIVDATVFKGDNGKPDKLHVKIDIAEGEFVGCFKKSFDAYQKWKPAAIFRPTILKDGKVHPFFKSFLETVKQSNPEFTFNPDDFNEKSLVGKLCGFTFGDKEWEWNGKTGISATVKYPRSVEKIRAGDFKIPPFEKLDESKSEASTEYHAPRKNDDAAVFDDPPF